MKFFFLTFLFLILPGLVHTISGDDIDTNVTYSGIEPIKVKKLDEQKWKSLSEKFDYSETREKEKKEKKRNFNLPFFQFPSTASKIIFFSFILLLLSVLVYFLIRNGLFQKNTKVEEATAYDIHNLDEKIHETDLEKLLQDALEKAQFKHAIRIFYLLCIKQLSEKNMIRWKKEKTNYEYLIEVRATPFYTVFNTLTRYYELVWYGDANINEQEYLSACSGFKTFIEEIKK